jgi:hypothetical protein
MMDVRAGLVSLILVALVACAESSTGRPAGEAFQRVTLRGRGEVAHASAALAPPLDHVASGPQAQPHPTGDADEGVHLQTWLNTAMAGPPSSSSTEAPLRGAWPADVGPISALWIGSLTPTTAGERGVAPPSRQLLCCCFAPLRCSTDLPPSACLWVWVCVVPAALPVTHTRVATLGFDLIQARTSSTARSSTGTGWRGSMATCSATTGCRCTPTKLAPDR